MAGGPRCLFQTASPVVADVGGGPAGWVGGILRGGWALRWSLRIPERRLEEQQVHGWAPCPRAPSSLPSFMALIFQ